MSAMYCVKCGTLAQASDRFCRICGAPLASGVSPLPAPTEPGDIQLGRRQLDNAAAPGAKTPLARTLAVVTAVVLSSCALLLAVMFVITGMPGNSIGFELIGTATPYPTATPYRTARPYPQPSPYPTQAPYPTTGPLAALPTAGIFTPRLPTFTFGGCRLTVRNQNLDVDSVVILTDIETGENVKTLYVRARDSLSESGIRTGSYYTYVTVGQNWDSVLNRFRDGAAYFRFEEASTFDTCSSSLFGDYQYLEITLNTTEGPGSKAILLTADTFPAISP